MYIVSLLTIYPLCTHQGMIMKTTKQRG